MVLVVKNPPANSGVIGDTGRSLDWEDPLEKGNGYLLQHSCLENPHGQRRLAGSSPWGHRESDTTERLSLHACMHGFMMVLPLPRAGLELVLPFSELSLY